MALFSIYKFLLAACISGVVIYGTDARRLNKRWIQDTGFGDSEYKRAVEGAGQEQGNELFPKFPGDEDEFEQEVQSPAQDPLSDKDKLQQEQSESEAISPNNPEASEGESVVDNQESAPQEPAVGQKSQVGGFEDIDQYQGGKKSRFGQVYDKENEIDVTTEIPSHKPWYKKAYKKVHGFFRDQYDYLKGRLGRGSEDYYVNQ